MRQSCKKTRIAGWSLLIVVIYFTLGAAVYFASLMLLQNGLTIDAPWIASAQKKLYRAGMSLNMNNWLGQRDCITDDPDLVYKPSLGTCKFDNIEFKTHLNFTSEGRNTGAKPPGTGIAVIGDSHAMGWGVNDHETFSSILQKLSNRPVYNLGVASYGTSREFIRLKKSGVLDKVDTVIVQYCNNDYSENLGFDSASREELRKRVFGQFLPGDPPQTNRLKFIGEGYWLTLKAPFSSLADKLRRKSFKRHYEPFIDIARKHYSSLDDKRVIVFYSNPFGQKYRNYPAGADTLLPNVYFTDLGLNSSDYFRLDGHMTPVGHKKAAGLLLNYLQSIPPESK
jgi:hypothetical protein